MNPDQIKINQLIEIEVELESQKILNLPSRIEGMEENELHISVPLYRGEIIPLRTGQTVRIFLTCEDMTYAFSATIVGRKWQNIPLLVINKPDTFIKIQRRNYMRLPIKLESYFRLVGDESDFKKAETLNISGGGALIITEEAIEEGQNIEFELYIPNRKPFFCLAKVVRLLERGTEKGGRNKAAIEYYDITESKRDKIINYIFEKQREWIRKGLF
jgi:c-di-GMP-binding flagellar brake protein YcgR